VVTATGCTWRLALERGLRAAGMILAAVYVLFRSLDGGWLARVIAIASTCLLMATRVNTILLLTMGAATFVAIRLLLLN
jgi:chromate transporter